MYRPAEETLVACVRLPRFAVQVERWRSPELAGVPLALLTPERQPVVAACSREAVALGVREGMPLREVLAAAPGVVLRAADFHGCARIFARSAAALEEISPLVEPCPPDTAYVGLEGLVSAGRHPGHGGLYPDEAALLAALERVIRPPLAARIGVGRGRFVAWAAARRPGGTLGGTRREAGPGAAHSPSGRSLRVADAARAAFLRPLPADWLPVSAEMRRRLGLLGLRTLGELAALPLSAVTAQFGPEGRRAWHLARGCDCEPLRPRELFVEIAEALNFAVPESTLDAVLAAVRELLERVLARPERRTRGVRQARLDALLESGLTWTQTVTFRTPGTLARVLYPPLRYRLERVRPPEPVERLTLALTALTASLEAQGVLFPEPEGERRRRLDESLRELQVRMGRAPVSRIVGVEPWSRLPERRYHLLSFDL